MSHVGDGEGLDQVLAIGADPNLSGIAIDRGFCRRLRWQSMDRGPLLDDLSGVGGDDGFVGVAVPDRYARPCTTMLRGGRAHQVTPVPRRARRALKHALERLLHVG